MWAQHPAYRCLATIQKILKEDIMLQLASFFFISSLALYTTYLKATVSLSHYYCPRQSYKNLNFLKYQDLVVLGRLARWVSWLVPSLTWLNLPAAVQEFADLMTGQVSIKLRNNVADPGCLSRIPDPNFIPSGSRIRIFSIPDSGSKRFRIPALDPHQRILVFLTQRIVSMLLEI